MRYASKIVKLRHDADLILGETTTLDGREVIEWRSDHPLDDGHCLTPTEARTLARALIFFANRVDYRRRQGKKKP